MENKTGLEKLGLMIQDDCEKIQKGKIINAFKLPFKYLKKAIKLSKEEKAELSLAELVDEKGFQVVHMIKFGMNSFSITIGKFLENYSKDFRATTREECKAKAFEYLRGIK